VQLRWLGQFSHARVARTNAISGISTCSGALTPAAEMSDLAGRSAEIGVAVLGPLNFQTKFKSVT
jgi:hypothetical protein